ncbi:MAG: hypothetical protein H7145_17195 [Akkermansiaceae bacterium]|nr:hypothetical protein [Armatimonadota bacterium]
MHSPSYLTAAVAITYVLTAIIPVTTQESVLTTPGVTLAGAVAVPGGWSVARLETEFAREIKKVSYKLKDKKHKARCVPLWSLLQSAKFKPSDPARKNPNLSLVVTAVGADGYTAAFSFGELSPEYGKRTVYIALDQDDKPLPGGSVELLVLTDGKPSRYVHDVRKLIVTDTTPAR